MTRYGSRKFLLAGAAFAVVVVAVAYAVHIMNIIEALP